VDVAERDRGNDRVAKSSAVIGHCLQSVGDAEATTLLTLERVFGLGDPGPRGPVTGPRDEERAPRSAAQPQRIRPVDRVVPGVGVGLPGLIDQGIHAQELPGGRVVVAPN